MLVPATRAATGFPEIPGVPFPDDLLNAVLDYDFGPSFIYNDLSGVITRQPPRIRQVLPTLVPRVNSDGNEIAGVASVLHQAPLGTYLGWNMQAAGFFTGQLCGFEGGYVPFAATPAERQRSGDPRPSLEERYGTREGYACVVSRAAQSLVRDRFVLSEDASRLMSAAANVAALPPALGATPLARQTGESLCR